MNLHRSGAYAAGWALIQKPGYHARIKLGPAHKDCAFWASIFIGVAAPTQRQALWWLLARRTPAHGVLRS
ncbi:hypothetical protein [Nitrococcus mobilis]|uniref:Uncharacterized protein n=1 Tax=Nitrococcus mobilis Nb-231 TaxID=314278 RepID=A4BNE5_9GAMM|nr:hypothetical protein [Nitrococcus mobilis]EAR22744.1 hypothetical protein NB231_09838 [Nitrococcus mobilis Nb-231]